MMRIAAAAHAVQSSPAAGLMKVDATLREANSRAHEGPTWGSNALRK